MKGIVVTLITEPGLEGTGATRRSLRRKKFLESNFPAGLAVTLALFLFVAEMVLVITGSSQGAHAQWEDMFGTAVANITVHVFGQLIPVFDELWVLGALCAFTQSAFIVMCIRSAQRAYYRAGFRK